MIEKPTNSTRTLICDACEDFLDRDFEQDDFPMMIQYAKDEGWTVRLKDGEWEHFCCASCASESNKVDAQRDLLGL